MLLINQNKRCQCDFGAVVCDQQQHSQVEVKILFMVAFQLNLEGLWLFVVSH